MESAVGVFDLYPFFILAFCGRQVGVYFAEWQLDPRIGGFLLEIVRRPAEASYGFLAGCPLVLSLYCCALFWPDEPDGSRRSNGYSLGFTAQQIQMAGFLCLFGGTEAAPVIALLAFSSPMACSAEALEDIGLGGKRHCCC